MEYICGKNFNMAKQILRIFAISVAIAIMGFNASALGRSSTTIIVTVSTIYSGDPEHIEEEEPEYRKPTRPLACTIDPDYGISFIGQETPDFIMYEIYDSGNACVGVYGDERAFIDALFSLTGEYRISLSTVYVTYSGYVVL